VNHTV